MTWELNKAIGFMLAQRLAENVFSDTIKKVTLNKIRDASVTSGSVKIDLRIKWYTYIMV